MQLGIVILNDMYKKISWYWMAGSFNIMIHVSFSHMSFNIMISLCTCHSILWYRFAHVIQYYDIFLHMSFNIMIFFAPAIQYHDIFLYMSFSITILQMYVLIYLSWSDWTHVYSIANACPFVIFRLRGRHLDLQLYMQSVPITTNVVSSNPTQTRCTQYKIYICDKVS
jgi:hypothetical protein